VAEPDETLPEGWKRNLLTPKLLAIALGLDVFLVVFAALTAFGLRRLDPALAFGGGGALVLLCLIAAAFVRKAAWAVWLGWLIQLALIASGLLLAPMYLLGGASLILWVWCLWRGAKADRAPFPSTPPGDAA